MSARTSARMARAMMLLIDGAMTPYAAAKRAQIALTTMYRSPLYKRWRDSGGDHAAIAAIRRDLDATRPIPRVAKKKQRFAPPDTDAC